MHNTNTKLIIAYVAFFLTAVLFSTLINGLFLRFSKTLGIRNSNEGIIRWSSTSKPAFGGISFYIIFLISLAALSFIFEQNDFFHNLRILGIIISVTLGFLLGLFDDAYNTKVFVKLFAQITCGIILIVTGTYIDFFGHIWLDYILTVVWVVGMMNSINMLDNMDGISSIVSIFIFTAVIIFLLSGVVVDWPYVIILSGLVAAMVGFMFFNWYPSKMYMGDTGSQFLGVLLAIIGILFFWNYAGAEQKIIPAQRIVMLAVMFVLPLTDTITVSIKRISKGKSPFVGGRDHTTHHLSYLGLSDRQVALVFAVISAVSLCLTLIAANITIWNHIYTVAFAAYFVAVFITLFVIANKNTNL